MIVCDANVLLYAYDSHSRAHARCREWLVAALNGTEQIGLPWQTLGAFVRIATNARVFQRPLTTERACALVNAWLARPPVLVPAPAEHYWRILQAQLITGQVSGALVSDAALAALAIECGAALCTTDRDFRRFDGLKLIDPTAMPA